MADTITVLDGIQFTKPDTADVWTYDSAVESVSSIPVILPADISAARVIFNAAEIPDRRPGGPGFMTTNTKFWG
jgi:hypothetical protein